MKNVALMTVFEYDLMMILDSGLLFWATLYILDYATSVCF